MLPSANDLVLLSFTRVCSRQLGILLVAVDVSERKDRSKLKLNPGPGVIIKSNTTGYFIAQSPEDVQR